MVSSMYIVVTSQFCIVLPSKVNYNQTSAAATGVWYIEDDAKAFAEWMARRNPGHEYHVMTKTGTVCTTPPSLEWK